MAKIRRKVLEEDLINVGECLFKIVDLLLPLVRTGCEFKVDISKSGMDAGQILVFQTGENF